MVGVSEWYCLNRDTDHFIITNYEIDSDHATKLT